MTDFRISPQLVKDTFLIESMELSELLLVNDARFLWCILVPRIAGLKELFEVPTGKRNTLFGEIEKVSKALIAVSHPDKLNVGSLGNRVPQLHIHVVARHKEDAAWPDPVWGHGEAETYQENIVSARIEQIKSAL